MSQETNSSQFWADFFEAPSNTRHTPQPKPKAPAEREETTHFGSGLLAQRVAPPTANLNETNKAEQTRVFGASDTESSFLVTERLKHLDAEMQNISQAMTRLQGQSQDSMNGVLLLKIERLEKALNGLSNIVVQQAQQKLQRSEPVQSSDSHTALIEAIPEQLTSEFLKVQETLARLDQKLNRSGKLTAKTHSLVQESVDKSLQNQAGVQDLELLFELVDSLDRALESAVISATPDPVVNGLKLMQTRILERLGADSIVPISTSGVFDPDVHKAVGLTRCESPEQANTIDKVVRRGYTQNAQTLRLAYVIVRKS